MEGREMGVGAIRKGQERIRWKRRRLSELDRTQSNTPRHFQTQC
ncbi:uncharacterized protein G2W53_043255 [Senna tora]|uniref:Uncharacterized protein n=1 Tax=Senna tora TaxID=362788 RepID=A0A834SIF8_9FABA|nr:uncharacterized protein G2W53_043255 [Senna tora]